MVIDEGVKVNSQVYLNMLQEKVLPWLTESFGNYFLFTQANVTQRWCIHVEIWLIDVVGVRVAPIPFVKSCVFDLKVISCQCLIVNAYMNFHN